MTYRDEQRLADVLAAIDAIRAHTARRPLGRGADIVNSRPIQVVVV